MNREAHSCRPQQNQNASRTLRYDGPSAFHIIYNTQFNRCPRWFSGPTMPTGRVNDSPAQFADNTNQPHSSLYDLVTLQTLPIGWAGTGQATLFWHRRLVCQSTTLHHRIQRCCLIIFLYDASGVVITNHQSNKQVNGPRLVWRMGELPSEAKFNIIQFFHQPHLAFWQQGDWWRYTYIVPIYILLIRVHSCSMPPCSSSYLRSRSTARRRRAIPWPPPPPS